MKKTLAILMAVAMLGLLAVGCGGDSGNGGASDPGAGDSLFVGCLAPLTGEVSAYGVTTKQGAELAFEEINANGGVKGKQLTYEFIDEKGDSMEAVNAYNLLVDKNMVALLGDVTSKPTIAVAELTAEDGMPMITATATHPDVTKKGTNVVRACFLDPYQGQIMAQFAAENLSAKTAAIIYNTSDDYSSGLKDSFTQYAADKGLAIVATEGYGSDDKDFKTQLTKITSENPDVIFVPEYYQKSALIATQAREIGYDKPLLGVDGWDGILGVLDEANYGVVENCYFSNHYSTDDETPVVANFIKNYTEKYNEAPTAFAALGYDAVYMLKAALENAASFSHEDVIKALKAVEIDGVTGHITLDEEGNPIKSVSIIVIKDGKYTLNTKIEP